MKRFSPVSFYLAAVGLAALLGASLPAHAQLRIVSWNSSGNTGANVNAVLAGIGAEQRAGIAKPLDVLLLQESSGATGTAQAYVNALNSLYGAGTYSRGTVNGATTGAGTHNIVFRTAAVQLVGETVVGTTSATGAARQQVRHQIRPVGYGSGADIYLYNGHYKSADTAEDRGRRNVEAIDVRNNANALGQGANIVYAGDFNIYRSSEAMWGTLTGSGNGQAFDPLSAVDGKASIGDWSGTSSFREFHTQSPVTTARFGGQTAGGMDDRFDYQLVSGELTDTAGVSYIAGTYRAFGNTNTHTFDGEITSGSASAFAANLPGYTNAQAAALLTSIAESCDHLPIVADYQIPARMGVSVSGAPTTAVLVGANVSLLATVSNTANVITANGADTLAFTVSGTGALTGGGTGTDAALGAGVDRSLTVGTTTAGAKTGTVNVSSSSEAVANGTFTQNVSVNVLDHANASFSSLTDTNTLTLDFGTLAPNGSLTQNFAIANLLATSGFTAGLDLDAINATGNTGAFSTTLSAFANAAAGGSQTFNATFSALAPGDYAATYTLLFSDQDLPGATGVGSLQLNVVGRVAAVVPESGSLALLALAVPGGAVIAARRRRA